MKLLKFVAACLLVGSHSFFLNAQIFSGGFRTNFGVDADLYANRLENGTGVASGLDDWFKLFGDTGSGFGFLDTINSAAIYNFYTIPANGNTVFEKRSLFGYQATFSGPTTSNKKFIDALLEKRLVERYQVLTFQTQRFM